MLLEANLKIAIIMCVYKGDDLRNFTDAVESITLKQKDFKLQQINLYLHIDGDISEELSQYINQSPYIFKVIRSKTNIGLANGLNTLLNVLGSEKYIFRMDADDICNPYRIKKQVCYMEEHEDIDILGGGIEEFILSTENVKTIRTYPSTSDGILLQLSKSSPFAHVTVCFRRSSIEKIGYYPTTYPLNEDIALWFQALKNGCYTANLKDILVAVRMDSAYQRRSFKKSISELKVYLNICIWQKRLPIIPITRFLFRLCPNKLVEKIYNSKLRTGFLNK